MTKKPQPTLVKVEALDPQIRESELTLFNVTPQTIGAVAQNHQGHSSLDLHLGSCVINLMLQEFEKTSDDLDRMNLAVIEQLIAVLIDIAHKIELSITPRKYAPLVSENPGLLEYAKWINTIRDQNVTVDSQGGRK